MCMNDGRVSCVSPKESPEGRSHDCHASDAVWRPCAVGIVSTPRGGGHTVPVRIEVTRGRLNGDAPAEKALLSTRPLLQRGRTHATRAPALGDLVQRMLTKDRRHRPEDAAAVLSALDALAVGSPPAGDIGTR
jgi:hypothetical protein